MLLQLAMSSGGVSDGGRRGRTILSCISKGTRISGTVDFRGMVIIEGEAEGEITGDNIEIAPSGVVMARITANRLRIGAQVDGEVVARERIEVLSTARLRCAITTPTLVLAEGAKFEGDCKMLVDQRARHDRDPMRP